MRWTLQLFLALILLQFHALAVPVNTHGPASAVGKRKSNPSAHILPPAKAVKTGAPKKRKQKKPPSLDSDITTKQLRASNYRKTAVQAASGQPYKAANPKYKGQQADHVLELQAVKDHINKNRHAITKGSNYDVNKCFQDLKNHLNSQQNLRMIPSKTNGNKGKAVGHFLANGAGTKSKHLTPDVRNHIMDKGHENDVNGVASAVDRTLGSEQCGKMAPGMVNHVTNLRKFAKSH